MKKWMVFASVLFLFLSVQMDVQAQKSHIRSAKTRNKVARPEIPRVSAYEAYLKYKAGKAIIFQAGGCNYEDRHILGAFNIGAGAVRKGEIKLPKLPKKGIEIFTYCY